MKLRRPTLADMRAVLRKLTIAGVALLAAALLAEVFLAVFYSDRLVLYPRYVTDAHYGDFTIRRNRPDTRYVHTSVDGSWEFRINNRGFRADRDFGYGKPPGQYRVIVLGDSHTLGYEVHQHQAFSSVLERQLRAQGIEAEVLNAGVAGFGTAEQLVFLREEGMKYHPDAVVLGFYANDYLDNLKSDLYRLSDGKLVLNKKAHVPGVRILNIMNRVPPVRWLSENSYVFSLSMNLVWDLAKKLLARRAVDRAGREMAVGSADSVDDLQEELALRLLREIRNLCERHGAPLVLVDIPYVGDDDFANPYPRPMASLRPRLLNQNPPLADRFVTADLLEPMHTVVPLYKLHGQRHISEYAHLLIGLELGRILPALREGAP